MYLEISKIKYRFNPRNSLYIVKYKGLGGSFDIKTIIAKIRFVKSTDGEKKEAIVKKIKTLTFEKCYDSLFRYTAEAKKLNDMPLPENIQLL
jgi:thermostable 8-oxoguanine DNA glycosylase